MSELNYLAANEFCLKVSYAFSMLFIPLGVLNYILAERSSLPIDFATWAPIFLSLGVSGMIISHLGLHWIKSKRTTVLEVRGGP